MAAVQTPLTKDEFSAAVELLRRIIPEDEFMSYSLDVSPATVYTTLVTLWMLTLQRLGGGLSLSAIVKEVLTNSRELLPNNKRVRAGTLSERSGSYSQARQRLPLKTVQAFATQVCRSLIDRTPTWADGRRAFIIDGTTMTLSPTSNLREAYPPATNQHGETVWPVMMLMVAHEVQSGCALIPEFGAMYGPQNTSEARQAAAIGGRIPSGSLVLADSSFGIFSVAYSLDQARHSILFRLTKTRFKSLRRRAKEIDRTPHGVRYRLAWTPSVKDRHANPSLPADACLPVDLHEVTLPNGDHLYLVTTLAVSSAVAADYYARRYDVEHNIRDMKVSLGMENIRAQSDEMVQKELLCSVVAYNLVIQLRREAAKLANVEPRRLSFTGVWTTMQAHLLRQPPCMAEEWEFRYERALRSAIQTKLPLRPGRTFPRQAHPRRPKSTKFMQQNARNLTAPLLKTSELAEHPPPDKPK